MGTDLSADIENAGERELAGLYGQHAMDSDDPSGLAVVDGGLFDPAGELGGLRRLPAAPDVHLDPYLLECVHLDPYFLDEEFARVSGDFARWNELYVEAHERYLKARLHSVRTRASRAMHIRRNIKLYAAVNGNIKITESSLADMITLDPEVVTAEDVLVMADRERTRIRGILSALSRKSEAMVTIGANQRAEKNAPSHMRSIATRGSAEDPQAPRR